MSTEIQRAVADTVDLVNLHAGRTCVRLRFSDDISEIDFIANAAQVRNGEFRFQAGFESYQGRVEELAAIRGELIEA